MRKVFSTVLIKPNLAEKKWFVVFNRLWLGLYFGLDLESLGHLATFKAFSVFSESWFDRLELQATVLNRQILRYRSSNRVLELTWRQT